MKPIILAAANNNTLPTASPGVALTFDRVIDILLGLTCYAAQLAGLLLIGALAFYGIQIILSRGNPDSFGAAKKSLGWAIVGGIVILGTYTIIATVATAVGASVPILPLNCPGQ